MLRNLCRLIALAGLAAMGCHAVLHAQRVEMKIRKSAPRTGLEEVSGAKSGGDVVATGEEVEPSSGRNFVVVTAGAIRSIVAGRIEIAFRSGKSRTLSFGKNTIACGEEGERLNTADLKVGEIVSVRWAPREDSPPSGPVPGKVLSIRKGGLKYSVVGSEGDRSFEAKLGDNSCPAR